MKADPVPLRVYLHSQAIIRITCDFELFRMIVLPSLTPVALAVVASIESAVEIVSFEKATWFACAGHQASSLHWIYKYE